jgi:hypothetical protein
LLAIDFFKETMGFCITQQNKLLKISSDNKEYMTPFCLTVAEAADTIFFSVNPSFANDCNIESTSLKQLTERAVSENKQSKTQISSIGRVVRSGTVDCHSIQELQKYSDHEITIMNGRLTIE